jgi:hypothetical protein
VTWTACWQSGRIEIPSGISRFSARSARSRRSSGAFGAENVGSLVIVTIKTLSGAASACFGVPTPASCVRAAHPGGLPMIGGQRSAGGIPIHRSPTGRGVQQTANVGAFDAGGPAGVADLIPCSPVALRTPLDGSALSSARDLRRAQELCPRTHWRARPPEAIIHLIP